MDKCPFCGKSFTSDYGARYSCGTNINQSMRGIGCYEEEIANLNHLNKSLQMAYDNTLANLNDLKERLEVWREGKDYFSWSPFKRIQWFNKLKDLGEITSQKNEE